MLILCIALWTQDYSLRIREKNEEENDRKDELKHTHNFANMNCL